MLWRILKLISIKMFQELSIFSITIKNVRPVMIFPDPCDKTLHNLTLFLVRTWRMVALLCIGPSPRRWSMPSLNSSATSMLRILRAELPCTWWWPMIGWAVSWPSSATAPSPTSPTIRATRPCMGPPALRCCRPWWCSRRPSIRRTWRWG